MRAAPRGLILVEQSVPPEQQSSLRIAADVHLVLGDAACAAQKVHRSSRYEPIRRLFAA